MMRCRMTAGGFLCLVLGMLLGQFARAATMDEAEPAKATEPVEKAIGQPELRKELLARMAKDQEVRQKTLAWMKQNNVAPDAPSAEHLKTPEMQRQAQTDRENREWLKAVVERDGWPGRTLVGTDGAHAAWLLVQHADMDFQRDCLRRMQECPAGEVAKIDLAYLTDRVRLGEGRPQIYGTQVEIKNGRWQPKEVEDAENLDRRRKEVGLPPIAEYLKLVQQFYGLPSPAPGKPAEKTPQ